MIIDKFNLPPWTQWLVGAVAFLTLTEKVGNFLIWYNDNKDDHGMKGVGNGFCKMIFAIMVGFWRIPRGIWWALKAIGRGCLFAWECMMSCSGWTHLIALEASEPQVRPRSNNSGAGYAMTSCVIV